MNYNFQALFTHLNPNAAQAMLQDLWKKVDEYEKVIDKIRQENDEILSKNKTLSTQNDQQNLKITEYEKVIGKNRQENEENLSKIRTLSTENHEKSLKIDGLTNEIEVLKMLAAGETLSCPVCLENFDTEDHQAYALSCPHIICSKCLDPALKPNVSTHVYRGTGFSMRLVNATLSERINNAHIIPDKNHPSKLCPVCRSPVTTKLKKICLRS